jgi:non-specific serine/threonine protein kinase
MIGQNVSHYKVVDKLGAGGMGEVFLAEDTELGRKVALKFLPAALSGDPDVRARFKREAQALAALNHPHIVTVYQVAEHDNQPFMVMEYVAGKSLRDVAQADDVPLDKIVGWATQIAEGLATAHKAEIVHRDIKSDNILMSEDHRIKILDFGLATRQGVARLTREGSTIGTMAYMSPEQAHGRDADHRSDLFSLGVVLYELTTRQLPFRGEHEAAISYAVMHEEPDPMARYSAKIPDEWQRIVGKCMKKDADERYQSAADLVADLKSLKRTLTGATPVEASAKESKPSIAVLPFSNMSADPENEFFADGLTEELLNVLARNPELKVTARTSSFAFKGQHTDLRDVGKKLGVESILEGSVRKAGNRVRITAQLVKVTDGFHLWSDTFDDTLDDIFAVQDKIADSVSKAMNVALLGETEAKPKSNPEALNLVMQAKHFATRQTRESVERAVILFKEAIEIDPACGPAWSGLANAYLVQEAYGLCGDPGMNYDRVKQTVEKALSIDDTDPRAWLTFGWYAGVVELDWEKSEKSFRKGLELAPGDVDAITGVANLELLFGNFDEARRLAEHAVSLDPLHAEAHLYNGRVYLFAENYPEAIKRYKQALALSPGITPAHSSLGLMMFLEGEHEVGLAEIMKEQTPGYRLYALAVAYHSLGRSAESDEALAKLKSLGEQWSHQIAMVHAQRGEFDEAFAALERSYELRDAGLPNTNFSPLLKPLKSDPRWAPFLEKIGLPL